MSNLKSLQSRDSKPAPSLSTDQVLVAVKQDLCSWLVTEPEVSTSQILEKAHELQLKHRGGMVAFSQFTHLERELGAAELLPHSERSDYVRRFLMTYFERCVGVGVDVLDARREVGLAGADQIRQSLWPTTNPMPVWNLPQTVARNISVLATDIDGSITDGASISLEALNRFEAFQARSVQVILTTGRSAGWACALSHYLPGVSAVLAENGAVLIDPTSLDAAPILLDGWDLSNLAAKMESVDSCIAALRDRYPDLRISTDNFTRLTDRTIEVSDTIDPVVVSDVAEGCGVRHTYSTVHHHLSASKMDKASGLVHAMQAHLGLGHVLLKEEVITVGDSLNDVPLFDRGMFAATVGVRSVLTHQDKLGAASPGFVTFSDAGLGFVELADLLLEIRAI
jgi:HAD superfamily hydrolase (TIGR01484 family)